MSRRSRILWLSVALAIVVEAVTIALRFGAGVSSATATASTIGVITFGLRVHHGYVGLLVLSIAAMVDRRRPPEGERLGWGGLLWIAGWALLASDLAHHVAVLWPATGSPQFDLTYR